MKQIGCVLQGKKSSLPPINPFTDTSASKRSMNSALRKKELLRITYENFKMLQRITEKRS